jgi:hypothetical protein
MADQDPQELNSDKRKSEKMDATLHEKIDAASNK